jgi:hypothetical protein
MKIRPIELRDANAFVEKLHRHHKPVVGHRFSIQVIDELNQTRAVCIIGRPVSRWANPKDTLEVTRLCTDGTDNLCSMLYGAAARIGREMGYARIQTFILDNEPGTSLRAAGWVDEGIRQGRQWAHSDRKPRRTDQPIQDKRRFAKTLREAD